MKIIDWLLSGDVVINRLTKKYLLEQEVDFLVDGYIGRYLELYNPKLKGWGFGLYSPKWISDHYTLLELKDMEISPFNNEFQTSIINLLENLWYKGRARRGKGRHFDVCVAAMLLDLASYAKIQHQSIEEIVDYLLATVMQDGGWNCSYDSKPNSFKSSLHTTLSVLEAFAQYQANGYNYQINHISSLIKGGQLFILEKNFFRSKTNNEIIDPKMLIMHYPPRWKYDAPRALLYFSKIKYPYDKRMQETLDILKQALTNGYILQGPHYPNLIHFRMEKGKAGRFNTLRALIILKQYERSFYDEIVQKEYNY